MQNAINWIKTYDLSLIVIGTFLVRLPSLFFYTRSDFPEFYRDYFMVSKIASGSLVLSGPGSILGGYHFGALYYYLFTPVFVLLNHHPVSLLLTSVIFSTLTVWGLYKLVFLWTKDKTVTRLVATLYMLSVYSVFLASFVSNPNFLPFFVVWALYHLTLILDKKGDIYNFVSLGLLVGFATQLHTTALVMLIPLIIITFIISKVKIAKKNLFLLVVSFFISNLLYIYFEISVKFQNFHQLLNLASSHLQGRQVLKNISAILDFFIGSISPFSNKYSYTNLESRWLYIILAGVCVSILFLTLRKIFIHNSLSKPTFTISKSGVTVLVIWLLLVVTMLGSYNRIVPNHYLVVLWPFPLIILSFAVVWFYQKFQIFLPVLFLVILTFMFQVTSFYNTPKASWNIFYQRYELYKTLPNISEIGNGGWEPDMSLPKK